MQFSGKSYNLRICKVYIHLKISSMSQNSFAYNSEKALFGVETMESSVGIKECKKDWISKSSCTLGRINICLHCMDAYKHILSVHVFKVYPHGCRYEIDQTSRKGAK